MYGVIRKLSHIRLVLLYYHLPQSTTASVASPTFEFMHGLHFKLPVMTITSPLDDMYGVRSRP